MYKFFQHFSIFHVKLFIQIFKSICYFMNALWSYRNFEKCSMLIFSLIKKWRSNIFVSVNTRINLSAYDTTGKITVVAYTLCTYHSTHIISRKHVGWEYQWVGMSFRVILAHSSHYIDLSQLLMQNSDIYKLGILAS